MRTRIKELALLLAVGSMAACGGAQVPNAQMTDAKSSAKAAEAMGARQEPQAALHLKMAEDAISDAQKHIDNGDNEGAIPVLERAVADANLARALTHEASTKRTADEAIARLNNLEREMAKSNDDAARGVSQ
jgi:predicted small lipoprotein YifL